MGRSSLGARAYPTRRVPGSGRAPSAWTAAARPDSPASECRSRHGSFCVACACDAALTAPHPAATPAEHRAAAFATLRVAAGRELDPRVVEALTAMLDRV